MTPSAKEFITPVTMSALSGKPVVSEFFTANTGQWNSHVDLGLWADAMIIAPATASSIAKMANGVADNMLITSYLSSKAPVFIAPAMDLDMMAHPSTTHNLSLLKSYGNHIIEPATGELASHLVGKGRMAEPEVIFETIRHFFNSKSDLQGKTVLVTAGPTYEKIDPVRFIGNYSTGKMGYAIADEAAARGAEVTIISGPVAITPQNGNVKVIKVESAQEMLSECQKYFPESDFGIMCAAVADYAPASQASKKIKREKDGIDSIPLVKNPDIAATLGKEKRPDQILVGFALETDDEENNALDKLHRKHLDYIVLNSLRDPGAGFSSDTNKISIFDNKGNKKPFSIKSKRDVARDIIDTILQK